MCLLSAGSVECTQWAHLYHKKLSADELKRASQQNCFFVLRQHVPLFSQLLISWNAFRPKHGHFALYVQVRNAATNGWGAWHRMIEWGNGIQRSHATQSDGFSKYVHVRLEMERAHKADAFRIKVVAEDGACLELLKSIAITTADMQAFKSESLIPDLIRLHSVYVPGVSKISQHALKHTESHRMCSPVSCTILSEYFTKGTINPLFFAHHSFDEGLQTYGSWPFNMAHSYEHAHGKAWFFNTRLNSFKDIHTQLRRGIPVVVSVRGSLRCAPQSYPQGHLLTVVGYDARSQEVLCHDSAKLGHFNVEQRYDLADFIRAWEASRRLTYWAERV